MYWLPQVIQSWYNKKFGRHQANVSWLILAEGQYSAQAT